MTALVFVLLPGSVLANSGGPALQKVDINLKNKVSLQNGAKTFMKYCLSCHSARFMRYSRMAEDIGLTEEQTQKNLIFPAVFSDNKLRVSKRKLVSS